MFEAARLYDEIEHTSALGGFLTGAVIGLALASYAAFSVCTLGFGGLLLVGIVAGLLPQAGEFLGSLSSSPSGQIERPGCSPDVFINGRNAALATASTAKCEKHPPTVRVAEGSTNVFINGKPAARKGDKLTCGSRIASGSNNVFIGGGTYRYLPVEEEVSNTLRVGVDMLMVMASMGRSVFAVYRLGIQAGLKAAMPCAPARRSPPATWPASTSPTSRVGWSRSSTWSLGRASVQLVKHSAHVASLPYRGAVSQSDKHFGLRSYTYSTSEAIAISQKKRWLKSRLLKIS